jgi:hypothetical protein
MPKILSSNGLFSFLLECSQTIKSVFLLENCDPGLDLDGNWIKL